MRIVFDTNIYIAAARKSFTFKLLEAVLSPEKGYLLFVSSSIIEELKEKILSPKTQKYFSQDDVEEILQIISTVRIVKPTEKIHIVKDDPDDNKVLECAVAAEADLIVSMDHHLLKLKTFRKIAIVHPKMLSYMFPRTG